MWRKSGWTRYDRTCNTKYQSLFFSSVSFFLRPETDRLGRFALEFRPSALVVVMFSGTERSARFAAAAPSWASAGGGGGGAIGVSVTVNRPLLSDVLEDTRARTGAAAGVDCEEAEGAESALLVAVIGRIGAAGLAAGEADGAGVDATCGGGGALASTSERWRVMRVSISACRRRSSPASGTGEEALCK